MQSITRRLARIFPGALLALGLAAGGAAALELSLPGGARLNAEAVADPGSYALPVGPWAEGAVPVIRAEGTVTRQGWRVPGQSLTTLQILAPLRAQLEAEGFEIAFECEAQGCGGFDFRFSTEVLPARQGIRATVLGASQYTVQVSGSTIFLDPADALPLRNLAVIAPALELGEVIDAQAVAEAVRAALLRLDLADGHAPVGVALPWEGSATYARLSALGKGLVAGLRVLLDAGHPLVLVTDGDIGGLLGMQCRSAESIPGAVVSVDGIALSEFDFIDIGEVLRATGATPVVVKSLLFPTE